MYTYNDDIYSSDINSDGSLNGWDVVGHLPQPLAGFGFIKYGNKIYSIGGFTSTFSAVASVRSADINPDGTVGEWIDEPALPEAVGDSSVAVSGRTIFVLGGFRDRDFRQNLYYATIGQDGHIANWSTSAIEFPRAQCCSPLIAHDNYLYLIGGHDGGSYFSDVYSTKFAQDISFSDLEEEVNGAARDGLIDHRTAVLLRVAIKNAEKDYEDGRVDHAITQLNLFKEIIMDYKKDQNNPVLEQIFENLERLKTFIQTS
jgi:hypothetical protein